MYSLDMHKAFAVYHLKALAKVVIRNTGTLALVQFTQVASDADTEQARHPHHCRHDAKEECQDDFPLVDHFEESDHTHQDKDVQVRDHLSIELFSHACPSAWTSAQIYAM